MGADTLQPRNVQPYIRPYTTTLTAASPTYNTTKENNGIDFRLAAIYLVNRSAAGARLPATYTFQVERVSGLHLHHDLILLTRQVVNESDVTLTWEAEKNKFLDWTFRRTTPKLSPLPPSPYLIGPYGVPYRVRIEGGVVTSLTVAGVVLEEKEGAWLLAFGQTIGLVYLVAPDVWIWPPGITEGGTACSDQIRVTATGLGPNDNLHVEILTEDM